MKYIKYSLIFLITLTFLRGNAQDTIGELTFETRFQLRQDSSYIPNLQFRYFFKESGALRIGFAYQYSSVTREIQEIGGEGVGFVEKLNSMFFFNVGYEKHFRKNKISPYFGGELQFGIGKSDEYSSRTDSVIFIPDYNYSIKKPISQFGVHLFSGVDFYVFDNLYIGTELGIMFTSREIKRGEYKIIDGSSTTDPEIITSIPSVKSKLFNVANVGLVRVGWRF